MQINKIAVIGCGGTGAMALQALAPAYDLLLIDGDKYEKRNMTRQIMCVEGMNKADSLKEFYNRGEKDIQSLPRMASGGEDLQGADLIFTAVDTNNGRKAAKELADYNGIPAIICGNETWEPMAWLYLPHLQHTDYCPFKRHKLDQLTEGRQESCAGTEIIEQEPQLPAANFVAGAFGLIILQNIITVLKEDNYIMEVRATPWPVMTTQLKNLKEKENE